MSRTTINQVSQRKSNGSTRTNVKGGKQPATVNINKKYDVGDNVLALGVLIGGGFLMDGLIKESVCFCKWVGNKLFKNKKTQAPAPAPKPVEKKPDDQEQQPA